MHTREELSLGGRTLSIETGKWARQAARLRHRPHGRHDGAWSPPATRGSPREGIDFLPLTVDYREYAYSSGRIPGGFFKREGKPTEKEVLTSRCIDRPIRPLFPSGWRLRDADHRHGAVGRHRVTTPTCSPSPAPRPRWRCRDPVREDHRRRPRRPGGRAVHHQPDLRAAQARAASTWSSPAAGRHRDGRGRREGSDRGGGAHGARSEAHAAIKQICDSIDAAREAGRKASCRSPSAPSATSSPRGRGARAGAAQRGDAHQGQARELRARRPGARRADRVAARGRGASASRRPRRSSRSCRRRCSATRCSSAASASMAAGSTKSARSPSRPACCRACTARSCSRAARRRPWSPRRSAPPTISRRSRCVDGETWKRFMLHYNFPPFSVGEVELHARPGTARNRPRRARRALARADGARAKRSSPTPSASSRTSSSRTAARRWPRSAAARWR